MSSAPTHSGLSVLFVGPLTDKTVADCAERLRRAGVQIEQVDDVYSAMARLATTPGLRHAVIDLASVDRAEAAFISLAPRYFPRLRIVISPTPGVQDRLASLNVTGEPTPIEQLETELVGLVEQRFAPAQPVPASEPEPASEEVAVEAEPALEEPASTEPESSDEQAEPSLHEAVRMRMAGNDPRTIRRRPPSAGAPTPPPRPPSGSTLSSEEVSALLGDLPPGDGDNGAGDETGNDEVSKDA